MIQAFSFHVGQSVNLCTRYGSASQHNANATQKQATTRKHHNNALIRIKAKLESGRPLLLRSVMHLHSSKGNLHEAKEKAFRIFLSIFKFHSIPPVRQCQIILHTSQLTAHGVSSSNQQQQQHTPVSYNWKHHSQPLVVFVYFSQSHKHSIWKHGLPS